MSGTVQGGKPGQTVTLHCPLLTSDKIAFGKHNLNQQENTDTQTLTQKKKKSINKTLALFLVTVSTTIIYMSQHSL